MIHILLTIPNFITAGSGLVLIDILYGLDRRIFAPSVCVSRRGGLDKIIEDLGVPVICAPFTIDPHPRYSLPYRAWRASQAFKEHNIDIWHSWHYADDYTEPIIARFAGVKNWIYTKKNMSWGSRAWRLRSLMAKRIAVNNPQMRYLFFSSPLYKNKIRVINQGVDSSKFSPGPQSRPNLRARLDIPQANPLVICVANLVPVKDHITLVRAVSLARSTPYLILAGKGDETVLSKIKGLASEMNINHRMKILGHVPHETLPDLLNQCDIFTLTSKAEGLPVSLLEAMACELPCIATRSGGPDTVIHDGLDGFLVDVGDYQKIAAYIDLLAENQALRRKIGAFARQKILQSYSLENQSEGYMRLYQELS